MRIRRRPTREEIAQRANELYRQRERPGLDPQSCWDEARRELEAAEAEAEREDLPIGFIEIEDPGAKR